MKIWRSEAPLEGDRLRLYFDFTLDNQEAITAQAILAVCSAEALAIPPPFGEIVAALILSDAADISAHNTNGNGVGANINGEHVLLPVPLPPVLTNKKYFAM